MHTIGAHTKSDSCIEPLSNFSDLTGITVDQPQDAIATSKDDLVTIDREPRVSIQGNRVKHRKSRLRIPNTNTPFSCIDQ